MTRLDKVLRRNNMSLQAAMHILINQGHEVEARPTAKITDEQVALLDLNGKK